ncbi:alpha/beta hydrolase [Mycolicibacterium confluentis]|nr:alpha/beta hydrolase [Mycolicibacterium confluentis]ORV25250.1 alpha/beta hydrolase [Mycolicibacterium confluentis]
MSECSPVESTVVTVAGVRSPVLVGGDEKAPGEAVVFVHGNNAGAPWTALMNPITEFARAVAPEMPGFGAADKPADFPYTVDGYARHLDGVLTELGVTRAHLVAHDFGGPWALAWAADHLDRVASITLINTPVDINHTAAKIWRTPVLADVMRVVMGERSTAALLRRTDPQVPARALDEIARHATVPETYRAVVRLYRATGRDAIGPYVERLKHFPGNVLIIWGDGDAYLPIDQARRQQELFAHAELRIVPGVGHWPWLAEPDVVSDHLTAFLSEQ